MRKIVLFLLCLLFSGVVFADQTLNRRQPREWDHAVTSVNAASSADYTDNTTVFANIGATGNQAPGNAGYLMLTAQDANGNTIDYYLWMDATVTGYGTAGQLRMASFPLLTSNPVVMTSFPYGDWRYITGFTSSYDVSAR